MKRRLVFFAVGVLAAFSAGCEDDDSSIETMPAMTTNAMPADPRTELVGVWKGPAGTGQQEATLELDYYYTDLEAGMFFIDGTLTWANGDKRSVKNANYAPPELWFQLTEYTDDYEDLPTTDLWQLRYDGTNLSGTGEKTSDGKTYAVFMTREN